MRRSWRFFLIIIFLFPFAFLATDSSWADTLEKSGIWFAGFGKGSFKSIGQKFRNYLWWLDVQARYLDGGDNFKQGIVRPGLGYRITDSTAVWLGYAWVGISPAGEDDFQEQMIWQQLTWSTQFKPVKFSSRTRLEQRFLETGDDTGWRFRQVFKLSYPLPFEARLKLVGYDEIFINMNKTDWGADTGLGQNRAFLGLGWNFDPHERIIARVGYLNQYLRNPSGHDVMNHILSINLVLNF
jgi:hypothetical protein